MPPEHQLHDISFKSDAAMKEARDITVDALLHLCHALLWSRSYIL